MTDAAVGRLLVASLHQGIADLLPMRLEFYEAWLHPSGLREGGSGWRRWRQCSAFFVSRAPRTTSLPPVRASTRRIGPSPKCPRSASESSWQCRRPFASEWWSASPNGWCEAPTATPTSRSNGDSGVGQSNSRARCSARSGIRVDAPLCEFYASAFRRLMSLFNLDADVVTEQCRATGATRCAMSVTVRPATGRAA